MSSRWLRYYQNTQGREVRELLTLVLSKFLADVNGLTATDLGCGDGTESLYLLHQGWQVNAIDAEAHAIQLLASRASETQTSKLHTQVATFWEANYQASDLIYAGLSLPFCPPQHFANVWQKILKHLKPGAYLAVHLFGEDDAWHGTPDMSFHSQADVDELCASLALEHYQETRETHQTARGHVKRWHIIELIARQSQ